VSASETAIFFHSDAVESEGKDLVGRRSAGQSFLKGYLRHVPGETVRAVTETAKAAETFQKIARDLGETRRLRVDTLRNSGEFQSAGSIFFPGPGYLNAAWRRQKVGGASCSLVGITHTVSTRRVIEGLHQLQLEPVEPWDAIICTSRAVQSVVRTQFELEAEYIRQRFGATRVPQPQLPLIPLGIHAEDFAPDPAFRAQMRSRFEVTEDAIVVLSVGRLSLAEKANPVPLFLALEHLAARVARPIHLWMVGWAGRDVEERLHKAGPKALCPSVTARIIDGRDPQIRRSIWSGADIFTLPVDNIQETFGLVPIEAMAAGLPVVMPDWNGFRDTIRHGETGILVPTRMIRPGVGARMAERFADGTDDYLRYLMMVQQHTQIDIPAYVDALAALADNAELRHRMGAAGRAHVAAQFDWSAVIPQYLDLAHELGAMRVGAQPTTPHLPSGAASPIEVDPFRLYADYPTSALSPDTLVTAPAKVTPARLAELDKLNGRDAYNRRIAKDENVLALAQIIHEAGPMTIADLRTRLNSTAPSIEGIVLLLAKFDLVRLSPLGPRAALT